MKREGSDVRCSVGCSRGGEGSRFLLPFARVCERVCGASAGLNEERRSPIHGADFSSDATPKSRVSALEPQPNFLRTEVEEIFDGCKRRIGESFVIGGQRLGFLI